MLIRAKGVDVNKADSQGCTALIIAAKHGNAGLVEMLLHVEGIKVNEASNDGSTPLIIAAKLGNAEIVALLLCAERIDVNKADNQRLNAVVLARLNRRGQIVQLLLDKGAIVPDKFKHEFEEEAIECAKRHTGDRVQNVSNQDSAEEDAAPLCVAWCVSTDEFTRMDLN